MYNKCAVHGELKQNPDRDSGTKVISDETIEILSRSEVSDLQEYISLLLERGEIAIVEREVDPKFELAAVVSRSQKESDRPILFRNVKGTDFPVIANIYGSFDRVAEMVDTQAGLLNSRWSEIINSLSERSYDYIREVPAPANLRTGNLGDLPHITWREKDAAPYITAGIFLAKDPDTGVPNLSFCRCMMLGDDSKLVCCIDPPHDLAKYQAKAEAKGEALDVAILIGAPPPVFLAAVASLPIDQDELMFAAQINGGNLEMRACQSLDLMVPAATEVVIETKIRTNERTKDGPFGEFLGYYADVNENAYLLDVLNVNWRENAYFQGLLCGAREDLTVLAVSWGARIYKGLTGELPGIIETTISPVLYGCIVKIDKQYESHARDVIDAVFKLNPLYNRMCVVVDRDIDIHDLKSVWWSFLTRGDLDSRTHVLSELAGVEDANYEFTGYLGIDATMPLDHPLQRSTTPGENELDLKDYFINS